MTEPSPSQPATARRLPTEDRRVESNCFNPDDAQAERLVQRERPDADPECEQQGGQNRSGVCYTIDHVVTTGGNCTAQGPCYYKNIAPTEKAAGPHGVCYALDSTSSNSMKSSNPNSGFHEESIAKTLDTKPDPTCNQGGNVIVETTAFTNRASPTQEIAETLRAESHGAIPMVASFMGGQGAKARSIAYCDDGTTPTIKASPSGGNTVPDTVYCLEGNTVDRNSGKNGKGYCEDVSSTLNTQDKHAVAYGIDQQGGKGNAGYGENVSPTLCAISHGTPNAVAFEPGAAKRLDPNSRISTVSPTLRAEMGDNQPAVCFQSCGDRADPSVSVSDKAYCIPANPMSDRQQAVCFQQNQREEVRDMGEQAGALTAEAGSHNQNYVCYPDKARSLLARADGSWCPDRGQDIVCYAPEGNYCGAYREDDVAATLQTGYHYGSGGDAVAVVSCMQNTGHGWWNESNIAETLRTPCGGDSTKANLVVEQKEATVYPVENHAADSRCELNGPDDPCQTLTSRMGTGGGNVPMILMKEKDDE